MFRSQSHIEYALRGVQRYVSSNVASLEPDKALAPLTRPSGIAPLEPSKATHRRLRIAILQNGFIRGGTERFVINLCKGLLAPAKPLNLPSGIEPLEPHNSALNQAPAFAPAKPLNRPSGIEPFASQSQYDITVINPSLIAEQQVLEPEVIATGATIQHTTTIQGITGRLKHLYLLYKLLRKGHYDVFHTNLDLFNGPNLLIAWLARVPIRICHAHASNQQRAAELESAKGSMKKSYGSPSEAFDPAKPLTRPSGIDPLELQLCCIDPSEALDPAKPLALLNRAKGALHLLPLRLYQAVMRWMCWTFANRHIGCSDEANNFLYRGHNWSTADYPTVLYNGIDLYTYSIRKISCPSVQSLNLPKKVILSVGRFTTQKNPYFILEIMEQLNDIRPDIQLIWVGEGELFNDIKKKTTNANISFLGWRDDVKELMQRSSLLLMPSLYEGLPLTLVEAQASGLPCLVSDTITKQAQCGLIEYKSLSESTIDWCNAIIAIIEGNHTMSINPQTLEKFSIHTLASQMQSVINDNH